MKLSGNLALNQFLAAATATGLGLQADFASARVGFGLREAPQLMGYDPTAGAIEGEVFFANDRPRRHSIDDALTIEVQHHSSILRNSTHNETSTMSTSEYLYNSMDQVDKLDIGILHTAEVTTESLKESPSISTCRMGFRKDNLQPVDEYLRHHHEQGNDKFSRILFDVSTNTVFCNQENDAGDEDSSGNKKQHTYGCAGMHFSGCSHVKCNGKESCADTVIEDSFTIECEGYESCRESILDADTVDCGGEAACMGATIGASMHVKTLDCHSGESACAYAKTLSVGSVFCTGSLSCYGTQMLGVQNRVTCQGVPHPHMYYMPTCGGGEDGMIVAEDGHSIDVVCDGDFACVGNGPNSDKSSSNKPPFFAIDVGDQGSLTCEGSLVGNQDGFTFVCKYIDTVRGCASYDCQEPSFASFYERDSDTDEEIATTCQHVWSLQEGGPCRADEEEFDDENDEEFDDEDNEEFDEEDDNDESEEDYDIVEHQI